MVQSQKPLNTVESKADEAVLNKLILKYIVQATLAVVVTKGVGT
jgi:hypothetical protein